MQKRFHDGAGMHQPVRVVLHHKVHTDALGRDLGKPRGEGPVDRVGNLLQHVEGLRREALEQTPPIHPFHQWELKLTGFFRVKSPLGIAYVAP